MPTEVNSMIVLDTSAGKGLWWLLVDSSKCVGSETTEKAETEHFRVWCEDFLRDGYGLLIFEGLKLVFERKSDCLEISVVRKVGSVRRDMRGWDC